MQSLAAESELEGSFPHSEPNFVIFLESNNGKMPLRYNSAAQRRIWGCILCDQIESCRSLKKSSLASFCSLKILVSKLLYLQRVTWGSVEN